MRNSSMVVTLATALLIASCTERAPEQDEAPSNDSSTVLPPRPDGSAIGFTEEVWASHSSEPEATPTNNLGALSDFGAQCFLPDGCDSDSPDWPDCSNLQCATGDCSFPIFTTDYGHCSRRCTADFECEQATPDGPYGSNFRCLNDGTNGVCAPGSNARCDYNVGGQCADEDEICKFSLIWAPDSVYGGVCQPRTQGAKEIGESCNESEGIFCANDLCLYNRCTNFCDVDAVENTCPSGFHCFESWHLFGTTSSLSVDMCLPEYCEKDGDCPDDMACTLSYEFNTDNVLRGVCGARSEGGVTNGGICCESTTCQNQNRKIPCDGGNCFDDSDGEGFCAGMCESDEDCMDGAYCSIVIFSIDEDPGRAPTQMCRQGSGSGRPCSLNADCLSTEAYPNETCEYVIKGQVDEGRMVGDPHIEGRCASSPLGAVDFGQACSDSNPCSTPGLCLNGSGGNFCGEPCTVTGDCPEDSLCTGVNFVNGVQAGVCIPSNRIDSPDSSLNNCRDDADCTLDDEHCALNVIGTTPPTVERVCKKDFGEGDHGTECTMNSDCRTGECAPRSTDATEPGYCFSSCRSDRDCADGFGCARQVMDSLSGARAKVCRPLQNCLPCAADDTASCAGDFLCAQVDYGFLGTTQSCLKPCQPGGTGCNEGFNCAAFVDAQGLLIEGEFVCTPREPLVNCSASIPR